MTSTPPADRYGSPARPSPARNTSWIKKVLAGLLILAAVGAAYLVYLRSASHDLEGELVSFQIIDDRAMDIRFKVTREDPSEPAVCIVRTRSKDGSETGRREVYVGPSASQTVELTAAVYASQPPAMGDLYGCSSDVPDYLHSS